MRLDVFLAQRQPEYSRSVWRKRIEARHVTLNGVIQTSPKATVSDEDTIETSTLPDVDQRIDIPILFENEDVVVVNKPVGILTHSKGILSEEFTVADFIRPNTTYKADTNRPGIIHRLDRATSGVLLLVKNDNAASYIAKQFSNRSVKKQYAAVLSGVPREPTAIIDLPIGRNMAKPSTFRVDSSGKPAETKYTVLKTGQGKSLIRLEPKTGRTHQLRVHMAYLGTPILGDPVYGNEQSNRMYLHAEALEVTLPGGERRAFTSPLPNLFEKRLQP